MLIAVDTCTREALAIEVDTSLSRGARGARAGARDRRARRATRGDRDGQRAGADEPHARRLGVRAFVSRTGQPSHRRVAQRVIPAAA